MSAIRSLINTSQWTDVMAILQSSPSQLCKVKTTSLVDTVLHAAAKNCPPVEVVTLLLEINSKAAEIKDRKGMTPLAHAIATPGTPNGSLELLLRHTPGGGDGVMGGVMKGNAARRKQQERQQARRKTLDALPSLGSRPDGMAMVDLEGVADSLADFVGVKERDMVTMMKGGNKSPLKPLSSFSSSSSLAPSISSSLASSPSLLANPLTRRSSFGKMIKSLFVTDRTSWRGGAERVFDDSEKDKERKVQKASPGRSECGGGALF